MTKMLSGENPKETADYIFPKVGGTNPDGSPRRLTTMFYLREGPMLQKHIQEEGGGVGGTLAGAKNMLWSKLLFEPFMELYKNRSYFGSEIWDTNAPAHQQVMQAMKHIATGQLSPMSISGALRTQETGGRPIEVPLALAGFGPAPKYAEASAVQNRITHLFREHVAPEVRAYTDPDITQAQQTARNKYLMSKQTGTPEEQATAMQAAIKTGLKATYLANAARTPGDVRMFKRLPQTDQMAILNQATPEERTRYFQGASGKTKMQWFKEHPVRQQ
jgi:hypothetical protein